MPCLLLTLEGNNEEEGEQKLEEVIPSLVTQVGEKILAAGERKGLREVTKSSGTERREQTGEGRPGDQRKTLL